MMKLLKIACLLMSVPLIAIGGEGLYHVALNREPVVLTCEQFVRNPPRARWLRITGCYVDYTSVGYQELNGRITALLFPVRLPGEPSAPAPLVAATRDPEALAIVQETVTSGRQADQESFLVSMLRIVTKLRVSREVEGYARGGAIDVWRTRTSLSALKVPLAQRCAVVDLHERPAYPIPGLETGAGVLLLAVALFRGARRPAAVRQGEGAAESLEQIPMQPIEVQRPPGVPPERRLPAILLLNLDAQADAGAIEHAPPLGTRAETARKIRDALGELEADGDQRTTLRGPAWSLSLDLGREEPVWAVTAHTHGEGAVPALQRLSRRTGWRLFIPKLGGFVDPADLGKVDKP